MKKSKIIILIFVITIMIVFGYLLIIHEDVSKKEKFKEITTAYETLMGEYDDQEFQDQK